MAARSRAIAVPDTKRSILNFAMAFLVIASFFSSVAFASRVSAQTNKPVLTDAVPAETVFYLEADLDQSGDQWTTLYNLLDRAGVSALMERENQPNPRQIGEQAAAQHFDGKAAVAFTSAEALTSATAGTGMNTGMELTADPSTAVSSGMPEGFVVLFRPSDPDALYTQFQQMVSSEAEQNAATVETTEYNGTTIEYWTSTDPEVQPTATAKIGDTVVLTILPSDIEPVVDTLAGTTPNLQSNETFNKLSDAFTTPSMVYSFVNTEAMGAALSEMDPSVAEAMSKESLAGSAFASNMYVSEAGFHLDTVSVAPDGAAMATPVAGDAGLTMAGKMPADALMFLNGNNLAGSGLPEAVGALVQMMFSESANAAGYGTPVMTPVATPTMDEAYAQLEQQIGFNLKTDLLDQLTGEWGVYGNAAEITSGAPKIDVVFVSGVQDEATVSKTVDDITRIVTMLADKSFTQSERDVNGSTVQVVTITDAMGPGQNLVIEYGLVGNEFVIGVNDGLNQYTAADGAKLADDPIYQQTMDALPKDNVSAVSYVNLQSLIPMLFDVAAASMSESSGSSAMATDADPACGDYATQEEAQKAYDADTSNLWNLDMDFDGQACEDFFAPATVVAPDVQASATPSVTADDIHLLSMGSVAYQDGEFYRTNSVVLVGN